MEALLIQHRVEIRAEAWRLVKAAAAIRGVRLTEFVEWAVERAAREVIAGEAKAVEAAAQEQDYPFVEGGYGK